MEKIPVPIHRPVNAVEHPSLPWTVRDPKETCFQCKFVTRERAHPTDLKGVHFCKWGPKQLTNFPQPSGQVIGVASWAQVQPGEWCHRWEAAP